MKFCKNLQRVVDISDPEWAPYFTNYKMLKKLIKELPSLVPTEDGKPLGRPHRLNSCDSTISGSVVGPSNFNVVQQTTGGSPVVEQDSDETEQHHDRNEAVSANLNRKEELGRNPGEIAFFKLIHAEFKKATYFFERAQQEFAIREERVREGMEIMKRPNAIMVNEKWSMLAKSIYRLYKDLLLLETFAIMTYCSFSKILKKHDKVTGHETRGLFMAKVVGKANFTNYPKVLEMISRCEVLYEEVSERLLQEGKEGLYEDERLFINMISRLNEQALDHPDAPERNETQQQRRPVLGSSSSNVSCTNANESEAVSRLRSLVEENDLANTAHVSEGLAEEDSRPKRGISSEGKFEVITTQKRPKL